MKVDVFAFYFFKQIEKPELPNLTELFETWATELDILGLLILGTEGVNSTLCGAESKLNKFLDKVCDHLRVATPEIKKSTAPLAPFRTFKVKLREEIVTIGNTEVLPKDRSRHLSPEEWQKVLVEESADSYVVLDTRNWYETRIGKFSGALDPQIDEFREFPEYLQKSGIPKEKKVLIYCTGGIRCEKAIVEMENQGFENVYQLDGGILNYLEKFPEQKFEGECFVFDHRVAVNQSLKPTEKYSMCPHCGQPADNKLDCRRCDASTVVCPDCAEQEHLQTCSKNCAHHYALGNKRGKRQEQGYRFEMQKHLGLA